MGLAELESELAELEPVLAEFDENLAVKLAEKEDAAAAYEAAKDEVRAVNAQRDPVRLRVMELQREIGQIVGIPDRKSVV